MRESLQLLDKLEKFELTNEFKNQLNILRELRNQLQHHSAKYSYNEWQEKIGEIPYYTLQFDEDNENLFNIQSLIEQDLWNEIVHLKNIFELHFESSGKEAKELQAIDTPDLNWIMCPECGLNDKLYMKDNVTGYCCFCRIDFDIEQCGKCGTMVSSDSMNGDVCDMCWERVLEL